MLGPIIDEADAMLFHISIEADDPRRVAHVLAEIWGGIATPFPPVAQGSWVALAGDDRGSLIEVYPRGTELHQGADQEGAFGMSGGTRRHNATHMAIATALPMARIMAIAEREGYPAKYCRRANRFGLIELWIEGCQLVEVLTPEMQREYLDTVTIENWQAMLSERDAAMAA
ncbi:hypothetical protein [Allosphingosinicella humi]